jgi:hypothetical protein
MAFPPLHRIIDLRTGKKSGILSSYNYLKRVESDLMKNGDNIYFNISTVAKKIGVVPEP